MEVNQHNTLLRNKNRTNSLDTRIHKVKTFRMQKTTKQKIYIYIYILTKIIVHFNDQQHQMQLAPMAVIKSKLRHISNVATPCLEVQKITIRMECMIQETRWRSIKTLENSMVQL